jgi:tetratricopeptide (TPR) repeat protein
VLALTSLLVLLRPSGIQALGLNRTNGLVGAYPSSAPVFPDYLQRSHIISFYEQKVVESPDSSIFLRLLADQYLRRFREIADVEDLFRAEVASRKSLDLQPSNNQSAYMLLASDLLSQHQFRAALDVLNSPKLFFDDPSVVSLKASIQMELGNYADANQLLQSLAEKTSASGENSAPNAVVARYLELTGHLDQALKLLDETMQYMDYFYTNPAENRAWFHVRSGDLAFASGEFALSERRYKEALELFPHHIAAFTGLARLYAAEHRWHDVLNVANQGIDLMPLVETLSYKVDAQTALGDGSGAVETDGLIGVVANLSQVKGIYDRALAVYYTEHGIHLPEALQIARSEVAVRDDIYAEDTLAWAAAANGKWLEAEQAAQRATIHGTQDALVQFHAGIIALHLDRREEAVERLTQALSLNPQFHHKYAEQARQVLCNFKPAVSVVE